MDPEPTTHMLQDAFPCIGCVDTSSRRPAWHLGDDTEQRDGIYEFGVARLSNVNVQPQVQQEEAETS